MATINAAQKTQIRFGLAAFLATGNFNITFIKADGLLRTLKVTLDSDVVPATTARASTATSAVNTDILPVYDLEDKAWKSITIENIISINQAFE